MPEVYLLTEETRQNILDRPGVSAVLTVERGHIRRFAEAIGDNNPLFVEEGVACRSRYGGIIAPPTFLRAVSLDLVDIPELAAATAILDGGSEWEYFQPVYVGDVVTGVTRVVKLNQRNLRVGPAIFLVLETVYTNQHGQMLAVQRSTIIRYAPVEVNGE